ncbi:hypothetical protein [Paenibacillus sp.]|jgi:hypothetical protein|uniref:hypothetical protein n=1 Tax=Paenibacillus sp. TaxID=58172 RepID=UPI00281AEE12|nr:hypothetical protein [Paenibacillus sp.]MDR0268412.1 hypothetical protein [Paenibacillus sp.]
MDEGENLIVYIGCGIGILILAAAGFLAWRNSRIIADKRETKGAIPGVSSYTVQVARQTVAGESGDMTPLFEAAYREGQGTVHVCLCRMNGTISELKLGHAVQIMEHTCLEFAAKGETVQIISHREATENAEENEAVTRLEQELQRKRA